MSLNSLNLNSVFPSNLNGLSVITTSNGGGLPVTATAPLIETTTTSAQNVSLYESSTNLINFATYGKSLVLNNIYGTGAYFSTGSFTNLSSTNAVITNLVSTTSTGTNSFVTNLNTTNMTGSKATITNLSSTYFTGTNAYLTNATIGNLTIAGANIPYLTYTTATGTNSYTTNTSATNYYNNANTNPMLYSINNDTTVSANNGTINFRPVSYLNSSTQVTINNTGRLSAPTITVGDEISNNISNSQNITTATLNVTGVMTGSSIYTSGVINAGGVLSTTSGKIQNGNSTWTTNTNDVFINANNDTVYLRPKGTTASPADGQVYLLNNGNLVCSTGTATFFNGYFNNALNAPNAFVTCYGIDGLYLVRAPNFTGANANFTNLNVTNFTGGNIKGGTYTGNVAVTNPQKMYFYETDGTTECMRIEPASITNALSFYCAPYGSVLQAFLQAGPTGASLQYLNNAQIRDYVNSPNAYHDNHYTTRSDGLQTNSMYFYNNTSFQSRPFIFQNLNQSAYIQAYGANSRNNGFSIRDTSERWFIYNQANTSTLAFNNNSSDLVTLNSSNLTVVPETKIQNTLNVGAPNFGSNALINLGYTGTLGGSLNTRQAYIYADGTNLVLNNQQYNNSRLQSSTIGSIYISPANGVYNTIFKPNGQMLLYNDSYADAMASMVNYSTGGYGLYINKPNDGVNGNNYYNLVIQGNSYTSAITCHAQVSGKVSNVTLGRTNYPFSDDAMTIRPYSTASQDIWINISNHYQESNGKVFIGQNGTGGFRPSDAFIQNHSNNAGGKTSGIYFQTDTANQGVTAPAQYIDYTGQIFMNPYTLRSGTNSQAGSAFSVNYGFKYLPQVGTVYTTSRGAGNYIPWIKGAVNNVNYLVAGIQKIQLTDGGSINASPFQVVAGARQYSFRCDWTGVYDVRFNLNLFCLAATNCFIYVYVNGVAVMTSIAYVTAGNFSFCNGTKLIQVTAGSDIDMRIQPDVNAVTIGNNSTIDVIYQG